MIDNVRICCFCMQLFRCTWAQTDKNVCWVCWAFRVILHRLVSWVVPFIGGLWLGKFLQATQVQATAKLRSLGQKQSADDTKAHHKQVSHSATFECSWAMHITTECRAKHHSLLFKTCKPNGGYTSCFVANGNVLWTQDTQWKLNTNVWNVLLWGQQPKVSASFPFQPMRLRFWSVLCLIRCDAELLTNRQSQVLSFPFRAVLSLLLSLRKPSFPLPSNSTNKDQQR